MRPFLLLAAAVALALYIAIADPFGTADPEVVRCPGGICPTPDHSVDVDNAFDSAWVRSAPPSILPAKQAPEVLQPLVVTMPLPAPERPATAPPSAHKADPLAANRGPEGWRLRLFYPQGNADGEALKQQITRMKAVADKYGFEACTTDREMFTKYWSNQIDSREVTLVLIRPDNRIVYRSTNIPTNSAVLRDTLREAARQSWQKASQ